MMRDFGHATGKDAIGDKANMPAPMQVKNFGMRSQVKWTHLSAEDTSGFSRNAGGGKGSGGAGGDAGPSARPGDGGGPGSARPSGTPLWAEDRRLAQKFQSKQGGHKGANDFDRPSAKRKKPTS